MIRWGAKASSVAKSSFLGTGVLAIAAGSSPYVYAYQWGASGFGSKYADPATLPVGGLSVAFSPSGQHIAVGSNGAFVGGVGSPTVSVYPWDNGFGTKYSDPSTVLGENRVTDLAFSPDGNSIVLGHLFSTYIDGYQWSNGFGTKFSNPATDVSGSVGGISISPNGTWLAVAHDSSPYRTVYAFNSSAGFGSQQSVGSGNTIPTTGRDACFGPGGNNLAISCGQTNTPIYVYPWSSSQYSIQYSDFGSGSTTGLVRGVSFSPSEDVLAAAIQNSPKVLCYRWGGTFGSRFSNPSTIPDGLGQGVAFAPDGSQIAVSTSSGSFIYAYPWSYAGGFGTAYSSPSTTPSLTAYQVTFKP